MEELATRKVPALELWTIGHSTRSADEFVRVLQAHGIECVADVRRFPGSRRHPQFGSEALADALGQRGIDYTWIEELGGRRRAARDDAATTGWHNASFAAYAAHLQGEEFATGLHRLLHLAAACRTAIMCSELLWWRCHRALVSDALRFTGHTVTHILTEAPGRAHPYTSPARIVDGQLAYPAQPPCSC